MKRTTIESLQVIWLGVPFGFVSYAGSACIELSGLGPWLTVAPQLLLGFVLGVLSWRLVLGAASLTLALGTVLGGAWLAAPFLWAACMGGWTRTGMPV